MVDDWRNELGVQGCCGGVDGCGGVCAHATSVCAGVAFANVLVFFQLGLSGGLYDSQKRPIQSIAGELVMVSGRYLYLGEQLNFPRARLTQALGVQGVRAVKNELAVRP